jgi:hypothetical protein
MICWQWTITYVDSQGYISMPVWFIKSFNILLICSYNSIIMLEVGKFKDLNKYRNSVFFLCWVHILLRKPFVLLIYRLDYLAWFDSEYNLKLWIL